MAKNSLDPDWNLLTLHPLQIDRLTELLKRRKPRIQKKYPNGNSKAVRRKKTKRKRKAGFNRYLFDIIRTARKKRRSIWHLPKFEVYRAYESVQQPRPVFSDNIQFLANAAGFQKTDIKPPKNGHFVVPHPFSFSTNFEESFLFLKNLFYSLYEDLFSVLYLDYKVCEQIDVDASLCMDIILDEFIEYYNICRRRKLKVKLQNIEPINFRKESIGRILFSIGTFENLGRSRHFHKGIIPFHVIRGNNFAKDAGEERERELTQMVDYIVDRCREMNRTLTWQAENRLSKVIGEVLVNAAEHSSRKYRYAIGYFEKKRLADNEIGVFNFAILSFGTTIYENFKARENEGWPIINRMKELSNSYTKKHWFKNREFEEETLWTLYALQEGVTSIPAKKRGNGSINFIESFFSLKGNMEEDNASFLTIISGNARITFDGKYQIVEKRRGSEGKTFKMMTFNESGNIEDKPDAKYVTFAGQFFPGTLITAKISINFNNIEKRVENG